MEEAVDHQPDDEPDFVAGIAENEESERTRRVAIRDAKRLIADGDSYAAIDLLVEADREARSPILERRIVDFRHELSVAQRLDGEVADGVWPELPVCEVPVVDGLPVCEAADLTAALVRSAVLQHGFLWVKGLFDAATCERFRGHIDLALEALHFHRPRRTFKTRPWYDPFTPAEGYDLSGRHFAQEASFVWLAESPRVLAEYLDHLDDRDVSGLLRDYFGQRPEFSLKKSVLRRAPVRSHADWHQDGAFMGENIRTLNLWVTLSDCGVDAPGLELVPRRLQGVLPTGTEGAFFDWSVAHSLAVDAAGEQGLVAPAFEEGDGLFFDQIFLHRTHFDQAMTRSRYAIESWFFAPGHCPDEQVPIAL